MTAGPRSSSGSSFHWSGGPGLLRGISAALAPHLARYQPSVATYARLLVEPETDS